MTKEFLRVLLIGGIALVTTALQGCFPLVAVGVGAGAFSLADRRTTGAQIDDESIELKISNRFKEQFGSAQYDVDVTSYNRRVLLTGQAVSEEIKNKMTGIAKDQANVALVTNEIVVAGSGSLASRSNDALITSNVKARLLTNSEGRFQANNIKVTTDNNTVYLLGIVTRAEGDAAAEVARNSKGVQQVVKVFEYIDKAPETGAAANK